MERVEMGNANRPWNVDVDEDRCVGQEVVVAHFDERVAITSLLASTCDVRKSIPRRRNGWGMGGLTIAGGVEQRNRRLVVERTVKGGTCFVDEGWCRESLRKRTWPGWSNV